MTRSTFWLLVMFVALTLSRLSYAEEVPGDRKARDNPGTRGEPPPEPSGPTR